MSDEERYFKQHIDHRCSIERKHNILIINLDHLSVAGDYLLILKLFSFMFIASILAFLFGLIFEGLISLIVIFLINSPLIYMYFYYRSRTFQIEINEANKTIKYQKVNPRNKLLKSFSTEQLKAVISKRVPILFPTTTVIYSLKFQLKNKRKKKIHKGVKEDVEKLGKFVSQFLEIPFKLK